MKLIHILRKRETTRFLLFCEEYLQSYTKKDIRVIKQAYDKFKDFQCAGNGNARVVLAFVQDKEGKISKVVKSATFVDPTAE